MKKYMVIPMMVAFLLAATNIAVFANGETVNNGSVSAGGPDGIAVSSNVIGINNNDPTATSTSTSDATGGSVYFSQQQILPAAGFVTSQVGVNGPSDGSISLAIKAIFENALTRKEIKKGLGGKKVKADDDFLGISTGDYHPTECLMFVFSDSGVKPGPTSRRIDGGTIVIRAGNANIQRGLFSLGLNGLDRGASVIYVSARLKSQTESKNGALSAVGTVLNACTFGTTGSLGIGGGTVKNSETEVIVDYAFYSQVQAPPVCPPVVEKQPCGDVELILARIHSLEKEVVDCKLYCYNNLCLRKALQFAYIDLFVCTKNKRYLETAIYHAEVAERNFYKGADIRSHQAEANQIIAEVYYVWAGCISVTQGESTANKFARAKKLERFPTGFSK